MDWMTTLLKQENYNLTIGDIINGINTSNLTVICDDNSNLTSITAEKDEIDELNTELTTITATLDEPNSQDVIIPFKVTGTAILESDYTTSKLKCIHCLLEELNQNSILLDLVIHMGYILKMTNLI